MISLSALNECLVPFTEKKIDTQLLWSNVLDDDELAELKTAASYLIKDNKQHSLFDPCTPLLADEKLFYAERYGGGAISRNGGGARCGFDGRWQVKGIGANALVGRGSKQVNGELTLTGAVLEALWGNLMAKLLPYGAVPNKAILLADNISVKNAPSVSSTVHERRALLVREPVIRPAHFCRA
ncbi:TPA: MchC protein, partial [Serratia fonticola]